jgi:hypothetical protein
VTFRYRVLILGATTPEAIEREYRAFTGTTS